MSLLLTIAHPSKCARHSIEETADTGWYLVCWNEVVTKDGSEAPQKGTMEFLEKVGDDKSNEVSLCKDLHHFSEEGILWWIFLFFICHWFVDAFLCCFTFHIILCMCMASCKGHQ